MTAHNHLLVDLGPTRADQDEINLIGACLIEPEIVAGLKIAPADFFLDDTKAAFAAMRALVERAETPILTSVLAEVRARQGSVSGSTLLQWSYECPTAFHAKYHALNVVRAAQRRRLLSASSNVSQVATDPLLTSDQAVDVAGQIVTGVRASGGRGPEVLSSADAVLDFVQRKEDIRAGKVEAIPTGFYDLDQHLSGGLRAGQLFIIGGRTGMGKSALLRDIARSASYRGPVLFASDEMGIADITDRDIAAIGQVSLAAVVSGHWTSDEAERIRDAAVALEFMPITNLADGAMTTDSLRVTAGQMHARMPFVAIVVDYLQRMADPGKSDLERVSRIARGLKTLAMELGVPVIAASQLSRTQERNDQDSRPTLIDLRSSGEIEQEADIATLLYRPSYYYPTEEAWHNGKQKGRFPGNETELIIAKQRQGISSVTVRLLWLPLIASFRNLARD